MIKSSEYYLSEAAAAAELARQQTSNPEAMRAHVERGRLLLSLHSYVVEREAAGLTVPAEADSQSVAFLDCHDRRWERSPDGRYRHPVLDQTLPLDSVRTAFGPLRPAEVSR